MKKKSANSGNVFLAIFGALAVVGVLGAGVMTFSKGPVQNAINITRSNAGQIDMSMAGRLAIMAAANQPNKGDCDADGYIEPPEWRSAGTGPKPVNGGLIPHAIGTSKKDPWGTEYGYCVWDHGEVRLDATCRTGSTAARLEGTGSKKYPVIAFVSAGPDKIFTTTCRNFSTGADRADQNNDGDLEDPGDFPLVSKAVKSDDDIIYTYNYDDALVSSGGLWSLKAGDATTAVIDKNIEAQNANVTGTGNFERIAATGADYLDVVTGLRIGSPTQISVCNSASNGALRRAAAGYMLEICDGSAWKSISLVSSRLDDFSDGIAMPTSLYAGAFAGNETATGTGNTGFGVAALNRIIDGTGNTAMGYMALNAVSTGSGNTAFGWGAARSIVGGASNTAFGYEALARCSACSGSTALGYMAARVQTDTGNTVAGSMAMMIASTGAQNTAIGTEAMKLSTTTSLSTAVGYQALQNPSANESIAVGANAMASGAGLKTQNIALGAQALNASGANQYNVAVGYNAALNTTGNNNTAVGATALQGNASGSDNTAFGVSAMALSTASANTGIGVSALQSASGVRNTAAGFNAGFSVTTGNDNTAYGSRALTAGVQSGSNNTGIGYQALASSNNVSGNTAVGFRSMLASTPGAGNTAMGYMALSALAASPSTLANFNTAFGWEAASVTTANNVTAIGHQTMNALTTGDNNTAIGAGSGNSLTTGSGNVLVGTQSAVNLTSSGSTAAGYQALNGATTATDNIAIGTRSMLNSAGNANACTGNGACQNASGDGNTVIGYAAGQNTGSRNVALGYQAAKNSAASDNVAIGYKALGDSTAAGSLTAFGATALQKSTTAGNTAFGTRALGLSTTGSSNTAMGYSALAANVAGDANTAIGALALPGTQNTSGNTAIGYQTLNLLTSGTRNTAVGYQAFSTGTKINNSTVLAVSPSISNALTNIAAIGSGVTITASNTIRFGNADITTISGQVPFTAASDRRIKKDIVASDLGLDFILSLKPVSYRMIGGNGRLDYGFLAQDVERSLRGRKTNMVTRENDRAKTYRLRSDDLIAPLVKAMQDQQRELETLSTALEKLR